MMAHAASFEAKASADNVAGIRSRGVFGDGRRRISNYADAQCPLARRRTASHDYAWRGGNFRRQPGDLLCLRQGKRPNTSGRRATCAGV